jgi:Flp pilus assembly protein CpaB
MTYRVRNIVIAVALAVLAAMLTTFYVANYKRTVQSAEKNVPVFVAVKDIPAGTSAAEAFDLGFLEAREIPRRSVVPGAISSPEDVDGNVATADIFAGEQVTARRFRPAEEGGVRAQLSGNLRAVQVSGDGNQVLAGTLRKGDRVDLIGNFTVEFAEGEEERAFTRTVLRDLLVLTASSTSLAAEKVGSPAGGASVQLAMTDAQAQKFLYTTRNGDWHLTLRSVSEADDSPESLETIDSILCDGLRRSLQSICFGRGR